MSSFPFEVEEAKEVLPTAENSVIGGIEPGNNVVVLYPKWRYSREQLSEFVKKCKSTVLKWGNTQKKVYWLGKFIHQFRKMLEAVEYSFDCTEESPEIEQEVFQVRRTAFIDCVFFSPNDLKMLNLRSDDQDFTMDWSYFTWWNSIHHDFVSKNEDCIELALNQSPEGVEFTVKELLHNFLLMKTDYLENA